MIINILLKEVFPNTKPFSFECNDNHPPNSKQLKTLYKCEIDNLFLSAIGS